MLEPEAHQRSLQPLRVAARDGIHQHQGLCALPRLREPRRGTERMQILKGVARTGEACVTREISERAS